MKTFFKDYKELCVDPQFEFIGKHWKGYILMCIGIYGVSFVTLMLSDPYTREEVKDFLKEKFSKKGES